jgi:hypothetical protein
VVSALNIAGFVTNHVGAAQVKVQIALRTLRWFCRLHRLSILK